MQVFRCALKLVLRNPLPWLIYTVALSFMGVAMAFGVAGGQSVPEDPQPQRAAVDYALIDRDGGALAQGVGDFLATRGQQVPLQDTPLALQDAVAKGQADYILIIPEGWGDAFASAAREGAPLPTVECVYSFYSAEGSLADAQLSGFASLLAASIAADPSASGQQQVRAALDAAAQQAAVSYAGGEEAGLARGFSFFLEFSIYSLFASIVVCVSMLLSTLDRTDVRRRNLSSPVSYGAYNAQTILACFVIVLVIDIWTLGLGLAVFHGSAAAMGADLPVTEPTGSMVVDIGGGTTEVAVISLGGIVTSSSLRLAGNKMDEAILMHLRDLLGIKIGERTAEVIKIKIGSILPFEDGHERDMIISGQDMVTEQPKEVTIQSEDVRAALEQPLEDMVLSIKETFKKTNPDLASDIIQNGILLTGGGGLLSGLDRYLTEMLEIPVWVSETALTNVVSGCLKVLETPTALRQTLMRSK